MLVLKIIALGIFNLLGMWQMLAFMGVEKMHAIGYRDAFGYVMPPKWFFLTILVLVTAEYLIGSSLFTLWRSQRGKTSTSRRDYGSSGK